MNRPSRLPYRLPVAVLPRAFALPGALFVLFAAAPLHAQEDPPPVEERCACVYGSWEGMSEALQEALERAREAVERSREHGELSRERLEAVHERLRQHLDTLRLALPVQVAPVRLGLQLSLEPVEDSPSGVRLAGVTPGSGAEDAGLREGDVVVGIDGHDLQRPLPDEVLDDDAPAPVQRLRALAAELEPGDTVRVRYVRDGESRTAAVEARRASGVFVGPRGRARVFEGPGAWSFRVRPTPAPAPPLPPGTWGAAPPGRLGFGLADLNPGLGHYFGIDEGALVLDARDDGWIDVRAGDVITGIDGRAVRSASDARRILGSYRPGEAISIEVRRDGRTLSLRGTVP